MAPSFKKPLNGQGVQRISGYQFKNIQIEIRLGPGTSAVFVVEGRSGREIEKEEGGYLWSTRGMMLGLRSSFYLS